MKNSSCGILGDSGIAFQVLLGLLSFSALICL